MNTLLKILPLFLLALIVGCGGSDNTVTDTNNTSNGGATGTLKGAVSLLDTTGQIASDKSGVKIELLGTSFSAISNSDGIWSIPNLPSRTYTLCYSKQGYDTLKFQFAFLGGETVWRNNVRNPTILFHKPVFQSILDLFLLPQDEYVDSAGFGHGTAGNIAGHFSANAPAGVYLGTAIILGSSPALDIKDYFSYDTMFISNSGAYLIKNHISDELDINSYLHFNSPELKFFHSGDTIYCRIYPFVTSISAYNSSGLRTTNPTFYANPEDQRIVYYGVGEGSNVLSVVMK